MRIPVRIVTVRMYICHHDIYCDILILYLRTLGTLIEVRGCANWSGLSLSVCMQVYMTSRYISRHTDMILYLQILDTLIEERGCAYWSGSSLSVCMYVIMLNTATCKYYFADIGGMRIFTLTLSFVENGTEKGRPKLVINKSGYSYVTSRQTNNTTYWICSARNKKCEM